MHDSIDEMPIVPFQAYNRFILIDVGIGGDLESLDSHMQRLSRYAVNKDYENLIKELSNYHQNLHNIIQHTSPEMMAFGALIHSVNGKEVGYLSDEQIRQLLDKLSRKGLTVGKVRGFLDYVKKKWMTSSRRSLKVQIDPARMPSFSDN